jgi:membrane associated rhomboid family serine protease
MFFLFPIGIDGGRIRVPIISLLIVALCAGAFLITWVLPSDDAEQREALRISRVLAYWTERPYLELDARFRSRLSLGGERFERNRQVLLAQHPAPGAEVIAEEQTALDALVAEARDPTQDSLMRRYALVPARGLFPGALTSMFLHFGWLHLLGNLFFLYLTGPLLEDAWGRRWFALFYLLAGLLAATAHFLVERNSEVMMAGASGAIAGLMGAFSVRFARRKVRIAYLIFVGFRLLRGTWLWPAWVAGLLWFLDQAKDAAFGGGGGVAVAAHLGGFAFGGVTALVMQAMGFDKTLRTQEEAEFVGPMGPSRSRNAERGEQLYAQRDLQGAQEAFRAALAEDKDDAEASLGLARIDYDAGNAQAGRTRLNGGLMKLTRSAPERAALVWAQDCRHLAATELSASVALALAQVCEASSEAAFRASELYLQAGTAPGLGGEKALLRAAELLLKDSLYDEARAALELLRKRGASTAELHAQLERLSAKLPAAPKVALDELELEPPPARTVESARVEALGRDTLTLQVSGEARRVPWNTIVQVAAGLVPRGEGRVLLIGLGLSDGTWLQLDSNSSNLPALVKAPTPKETFSRFLAGALHASKARAIPSDEALRSGQYPSFESEDAWSAALQG